VKLAGCVGVIGSILFRPLCLYPLFGCSIVIVDLVLGSLLLALGI
jgi:hypothetical protein